MHHCHILWMPKADLEHDVCTAHQSACSKTSKLFTVWGLTCTTTTQDSNGELLLIRSGIWWYLRTEIYFHFYSLWPCFPCCKINFAKSSFGEKKKCLNPSDLMCLVMSELFSAVYFYLNKCSITDLKFSLLSRQRTWSVWKPFKSLC